MEKEILLRINQAKVRFTYVEETIAEYFISGRPPLAIHELARELNISSSSITRFCKKIGLHNFKELMYLYEKHLEEKDASSASNISLHLQSEYFRIFHVVDQAFDMEAIKQACLYIFERRIISVYAFGLSATAAEDFRFRFSRLGKFIEVVHDKDAIKMSASALRKDDLVLIFTLRGNAYFDDLARFLKGQGVVVITITGNEKSSLAKNSDVALFTASLSGEESTGMISGQIPILIVIDLLYYHYVSMYSDALKTWASTEEVFQGGAV